MTAATRVMLGIAAVFVLGFVWFVFRGVQLENTDCTSIQKEALSRWIKHKSVKLGAQTQGSSTQIEAGLLEQMNTGFQQAKGGISPNPTARDWLMLTAYEVLKETGFELSSAEKDCLKELLAAKKVFLEFPR